jgi:hypothetical protein
LQTIVVVLQERKAFALSFHPATYSFDCRRPSLPFPQSIKKKTFHPDTLTEARIPLEFHFPKDGLARIVFC